MWYLKTQVCKKYGRTLFKQQRKSSKHFCNDEELQKKKMKTSIYKNVVT